MKEAADQRDSERLRGVVAEALAWLEENEPGATEVGAYKRKQRELEDAASAPEEKPRAEGRAGGRK